MDAPVRFLFLKYAAETPAEFQYDWIAELRDFFLNFGMQFSGDLYRKILRLRVANGSLGFELAVTPPATADVGN